MTRRMLVYGVFLCVLAVSVNSATAASDLAEVIALPNSPKGGVIIYLGGADADAMIKSRDAGRFVVQSVLFDTASVNKSREAILAKKAYGLVAVIRGSGKRLAYTDNFVNIVVIDNPAAFTKAAVPAVEVARIVVPKGVVLVAGDDSLVKAIAKAMGSKEVTKASKWTMIVKPRPKEMDEWTHGRHDPEGTSISQDKLVGYSGVLQWRQGPIWLWPGISSRTIDGKNYYYVKGEIVCRDAFNGVLIWRIHAQEQKSFTALGKRVYAFIPGVHNLVALDAATGKVVQHYRDIRGVCPLALVHVGGNIVFAADDGLGSVNRKTGKLNWMNKSIRGSANTYTKPYDRTWKHGRLEGWKENTKAEILVSGNYILRKRANKLTCLGLANGKQLWTQDYPGHRLRVAKYGVYALKYFQGSGGYTSARKKGSIIEARSLKDGSTLWKHKINGRIGPGTDLHAFDGLIWDTTGIKGYDPQTGELKKQAKGFGGSTEAVLRCVMDIAATVNYFFRGRPFGFVNIHTGQQHTKQFVRNVCGGSPGVLPGNGMVYCFPKLCSCFSMLRGYTGLATPKPLPPISDTQRLLKGPAYGTVAKAELTDEYAAGWATYLGNEQRSGFTNEKVNMPLKQSWAIEPEDQVYPQWTKQDWKSNYRVSGTISAPTASRGMVAAALPESHRIKIFEARTGRDLWSFVAESRVVTPPTFYGKMVLFGSEDGYVYCLRSKDGALIWRYQAAPAQRRVSIFGQIESHFPVTCGVLVKNGNVYFAAGRHGDLNNGVTGYNLDAYTGQLAWKKMMETVVRKSTVPIPDIPVYVNGNIRLAQHAQVFNEQGEGMLVPYEALKKRGKTRLARALGKTSHNEVLMLKGGLTGMLDHTWSRSDRQGNNNIPAYSQSYGSVKGGHVAYNKTMAYALRGDSVTAYDVRLAAVHIPHHKQIPKMPPQERALMKPKWSGSVIGEARAMAVTNEIVVVAAKSGDIVVFDANTGKDLSKVKINGTPARWGLAISGGRIYVSTDNGKLICLSGAI
jgi:outer membrane protein assembly factor BamB